MGSLAAAVASYLRARQAGGEWLLRIEDIDPPREARGASATFLTTLECFGFEWDGEITYQSTRFERYRDVLHTLAAKHLVYRCRCSRRDVQLAIASQKGPDGVYPGTCLKTPPEESADVSWRFKTDSRVVAFTDALQGRQRVQFGRDQGDFVVWRKDDLPSYQLAVTVDDLEQGITEVVRGIDLLQETAGQILIRKALTDSQTAWMHIPVIVNAHGEKLSKQTAAPPLDIDSAAQQLCTVLGALGLSLDNALMRASVPEIWAFAIENWEPNSLLNIKKTALD